MRDELNLGSIDKAMYTVAKNVFKYVFTGDRPETNNTKPDAFCVVALNGRLYDNLVLGESIAKFSCFIQENDDGTENTSAKDNYVCGLLKLLPCTIEKGTYTYKSTVKGEEVEKEIQVDTNCQFFNPTVLPMGNDGKGFFQYVVYTNLIIV